MDTITQLNINKNKVRSGPGLPGSWLMRRLCLKTNLVLALAAKFCIENVCVILVEGIKKII